MTKKQKIKIARILIAAAMLAALAFVPVEGIPRLCLYLAPYLIVGYDTLLKALRGCLHLQMFDEDFLMALATVGALIIGEYPEAVAVMLFNQIGVLFEQYAVGRSRKSIAALMDIRPDYANLEKDGAVVEVSPDEVAIGDIIVIKAGEKVPLDGIIEEGTTSVDTAALTGESMPRTLGAGDAIISGSINLSGHIRVRVTKIFEESTVSKILELVENASAKKAKAENFISKFARWYTPIVVGAALVLAVVPSLFDGNWSEWLYRALTFLVISCPCALVISVPLSFFGGIGGASKCGILIKGGNYIEALARCETVVFDKTGTLTKGNFAVTAIHTANGIDENTVIAYAALAESDSSHPIARSICEAWTGDVEEGYVLTDLSGLGVRAERAGDVILCGNERLMRESGIALSEDGNALLGTAVYVAHNGVYAGRISITDEARSESREVLSALRASGAETVMLTGDRAEVAERVASELGISAYRASLLPQDKVREVEKRLTEKGKGDVLCFIGDGINDAPVLMLSDVGVAMGGVGSDAAIEAADVVLMKDDLCGLLTAQRIAKETMRTVRQNVAFSLAVKGAILLLSAFGIANMWIAIFGDVGVAVLAILNAMRVGRLGKGAE